MEWFAYNENADLGAVLMAAYLIAIGTSKTKDSSLAAMAFIASNLYCISPLYKYTIDINPSLVFLIYASIYFTAIRFITTYKVIAACFIMALFEGLMYKAYLNELGNKGIEDGLYDNYEYIVTLLHLTILFSMVRWDVIRSSYRILRDNLLFPFLHQRLLLPYGS